MNNKVKIRVEIDPSCSEPEVVIRTDRETEYIRKLVSDIEKTSEKAGSQIRVYDRKASLLISQDEIVRVYTEPRKLMVQTAAGETYEARSTLKDLEMALDEERFVKISRFEVINMERVAGFDVSVSGTIRVTFEDGTTSWVARRYVRAIEQKLTRQQGRAVE